MNQIPKETAKQLIQEIYECGEDGTMYFFNNVNKFKVDISEVIILSLPIGGIIGLIIYYFFIDKNIFKS